LTSAVFIRNGERSKSSSLSEPSGAGQSQPEPQQQELVVEPLLNGDIKPGKTPVVSINSSQAADRDGAISPRTYAMVIRSFLEYVSGIHD
jgi:hypothetical protein